MEITKKDMNITKGVAILMMLLLHLFCRKEYEGLYEPLIYIGNEPLIYYLALFGDACVPIYCFASGYGLYFSYTQKNPTYKNSNRSRLSKLILNYWIILILFVGLGNVIRPNIYPGSFIEFINNMLLLSNSYNGAWWFLQTYVLLVLLSPYILKMVKKTNSKLIFFLALSVYFVSYVFRIKQIIDLGDNQILIFLFNTIVLIGTSLFPFIIGSLFLKENIYAFFSERMRKIKFKNLTCSIGILILIVFHGFIESMFVAPFTAITFICFFNAIDKSLLIKNTLNFFGNHSTNIWLTHMFFYMTIFPTLTFAPKYPILIFLWLIILCLCSSFLINLVFKPISKYIDNDIINQKTKISV
ncbi:acyltransferase family protein [Robertmurraya sp. P23]|uniref:acyltransferase family protein n=1 Tax=Robertmurraya sp. P23 TaxID=3436931 RepID=UPI003D9A09DA